MGLQLAIEILGDKILPLFKFAPLNFLHATAFSADKVMMRLIRYTAEEIKHSTFILAGFKSK